MALTYLERFIHESIGDAYRKLRGVTPTVATHVQPSDRPEFGDYSSSIAMVVASQEGIVSRKLATDLVEILAESLPTSDFRKVEVAGPGFINIFLAPPRIQESLRQVLEAGDAYGRRKHFGPNRIQVEFVSSNPTGPLTVGHGRQAVLGDVLARLYVRMGYTVEREYYFNDQGRQIDLLAESLWARHRAIREMEYQIPLDGYHGGYLEDVAREVDALPNKEFLEGIKFASFDPMPGEVRAAYREQAVARMIARIKDDLKALGVRFDNWFSEATLHRSGAVDRALEELKARGAVYEEDGADWLRVEEHGGAKDSVLRRSDEQRSYTYLMVDIAYHINKHERGFDRVINVQGADHHAEQSCMLAAMRLLGYEEDWLQYAVHQFVSLKEGGETLKMSTRAGRFVTLHDLLEELGGDVVRWFMISRKPEAHLDFDLDLARTESQDNPATYVQYAHTRIASIFRKAKLPETEWCGVDLAPLVEPEELDLIKSLDRFPGVVEKAAEAFAPHLVTDYALQLSRAFHAYYDKHRILTDSKRLTHARLALLHGVKIVLRESLLILGMSIPESM